MAPHPSSRHGHDINASGLDGPRPSGSPARSERAPDTHRRLLPPDASAGRPDGAAARAHPDSRLMAGRHDTGHGSALDPSGSPAPAAGPRNGAGLARTTAAGR